MGKLYSKDCGKMEGEKGKMKYTTILKVIKKPKVLLSILAYKGFFNWTSDEFYLKYRYRIEMNKKLNLENPKTFSEKLQWLKLYDRNPLYTTLVDKYAVKEYIAKKIGEEYIIPTLGVWDKFDDIDFDKLPNQFVLKCTHDCGGIVICKDKSKMDIKSAKKKINKHLKNNFYYSGREWPYKNVKPRIIAEKYVEDESGYELKDYKFFCFHGEPKILFIATDRGTDTKFDFYNTEFEHLGITNGHPNATKEIRKPKNYEKMLEVVSELSKNIPHVRVDLYNNNGQILFGEMTFYHWSGFVPFEPEEWDKIMGDWLVLPEKKQR